MCRETVGHCPGTRHRRRQDHSPASASLLQSFRPRGDEAVRRLYIETGAFSSNLQSRGSKEERRTDATFSSRRSRGVPFATSQHDGGLRRGLDNLRERPFPFAAAPLSPKPGRLVFACGRAFRVCFQPAAVSFWAGSVSRSFAHEGKKPGPRPVFFVE
jgi:hypothetical protein